MSIMCRLLCCLILLSPAAFAERGRYDHPSNHNYPTIPDPTLTPGELCNNLMPKNFYDTRKGIIACERDVAPATKRAIKATYDKRHKTRTQLIHQDFIIIDHLVPLCMGGSNNVKNLWPQHRDVSEITNLLEPGLCQLMDIRKISQRDAVQAILAAKRDPKGPIAKSTLDYVTKELNKAGIRFNNRR